MGSTYIATARWREAIRAGREDRTARRAVNAPISSPRWGDTEVRTWPTREAMARAIRREEDGPFWRQTWIAVVPLMVTEGYR